MPIALSKKSIFSICAVSIIFGLAAIPSSFAAAKPETAPDQESSPSPTAVSLYVQSLEADDLYAYRGRQITTYWHSGRAVATVVSHLPLEYRRIDYIAPDSVRGRCLVSDGVQEWQYYPSRKLLLHRRVTIDEAVAGAEVSYDLLRQNYNLSIVPEKKIWADRKVYVLNINRKSDKTIARKLWLDAYTGLVLKREMYNEDGKMRVTVAYSDISYHPMLTAAMFDLSSLAKRPGVTSSEETAAGEQSIALTHVQSQLGAAALAPAALGGYKLVSAATTQVSGKTMLHLRYSDGLNLISVFEGQRMHLYRPTRVPSSMQALQLGRWAGHVTHRSSLTTINWDTATLNITIIGEISDPNLIALANELNKA